VLYSKNMSGKSANSYYDDGGIEDLGYDQVYNLGAFKDWAESGGTVEKAGQT
jgi:hypothetical protein